MCSFWMLPGQHNGTVKGHFLGILATKQSKIKELKIIVKNLKKIYQNICLKEIGTRISAYMVYFAKQESIYHNKLCSY